MYKHFNVPRWKLQGGRGESWEGEELEEGNPETHEVALFRCVFACRFQRRNSRA